MKSAAWTNSALLFLAMTALGPFALPGSLSDEDLAQRTIERRAVEAVIWGMPAVNYELMWQAAQKAGARENQIVYWGRPSNWHNQTLTPNPDAIYLLAFFTTKDVGPMVLEVPPAGEDGSLTANIDDLWQMPLEDAGPAGADKGQGGKYLILPPGHADNVPEGFIALRPGTQAGYALLRSTLKSHAQADIDKAVAYGRRIKLYPLSQAANPGPTTFIDVKDQEFDSTIPFDLRFFTSLDRIVQGESWLERDRAMIDPLRSLGIEKGKPFAPDARTKAQLEAGAKEAQAWLDAKYDESFVPFFAGSRWSVPMDQRFVEEIQTGYADPNQYFTDVRGVTYSFGFIGIKRLGSGQFYLLTIKDKDGAPLDGGNTYRLTVPAHVPIEQYWSITAYDRQTHALIRNMARASRASNAAEVRKNKDGTVDIYFGPAAPRGKEANWVPTDPKRGFELMFRLYRPTPAFFDKQWVLPDVVKVTEAAPASTAQPEAAQPVPVTADNFNRAETDMYFKSTISQAGGLGKFHHHREAMRIDNQTVVRANRDTLYSSAVFDLDAGPATITLPDPAKRFMSMIVIDEDQYALTTVYAPGTHTFTRDQVGTRYVLMGIRTFINPASPQDMDKAHALQDAVKVNQASAGRLELPNWDAASQKTVRDSLLVLAATIPDTKRMFGPKDQVDPVRHLIGTATGWGGNAEKDAVYLTVVPPGNDGKTIYTLDVKDVPVDGFWSISVYNAQGYFEPNSYEAYSLNNVTAKKNADGSASIQFGGCDGKIPNCLPITAGWNYWVRLYRPRAEVLDGSWRFPEPKVVR